MWSLLPGMCRKCLLKRDVQQCPEKRKNQCNKGIIYCPLQNTKTDVHSSFSVKNTSLCITTSWMWVNKECYSQYCYGRYTLLKCSAMWLFPHPTSRARGKVLQWHSGIKHHPRVIQKPTAFILVKTNIIQDVKVDVTVKADGDWSCWALKTLYSNSILFFKHAPFRLGLYSFTNCMFS